MHDFRKELTIILEGESTRDFSEEELFSKLKISFINWWENNPGWPYGKPCIELRELEVKSIKLKTNP